MTQASFENEKLTLSVKKSPLIIRAILLVLSCCFFLFPTLGTIASVSQGGRLGFGVLLMIGVMALLGFYLLRIFLWNTYGKETFEWKTDGVWYEADYRWFRDGRKQLDSGELIFSAKTAGYEEDRLGTLIAFDGSQTVHSAVKLPMDELEKIIGILSEKTQSSLVFSSPQKP